MARPSLVAVPAVIVLLLAGAAGARAQGIGDAAARERQKRAAQQKAKEPARVYGNQDLPQHEPEKGDQKKGGTKAAEPAPAPPPVGGESGGSDATSELAARRARVAQAESAVATAKAQVDRLEARLRELQDMLNPMSGTYIYGARASGDVASQEARVRDELRQTEAGLGDARKALDAANHDLEDAQLGRMPSPQS